MKSPGSFWQSSQLNIRHSSVWFFYESFTPQSYNRFPQHAGRIRPYLSPALREELQSFTFPRIMPAFAQTITDGSNIPYIIA